MWVAVWHDYTLCSVQHWQIINSRSRESRRLSPLASLFTLMSQSGQPPPHVVGRWQFERHLGKYVATTVFYNVGYDAYTTGTPQHPHITRKNLSSQMPILKTFCKIYFWLLRFYYLWCSNNCWILRTFPINFRTPLFSIQKRYWMKWRTSRTANLGKLVLYAAHCTVRTWKKFITSYVDLINETL